MIKRYGLSKRLGIFSVAVIFMLCVAMVLHTPSISTLFNHRVASQSFDEIVQQSSEKRDSRAESFKMPESWWDEGAVASDFDAGSGTSEDPYQIATPEQLALMQNKINNQGGAYLTASYQLTSDIDMSEHFWASMGTWAGDRFFKGTFDGGTHDIDADGNDHGVVHTITGLIMKNRESVDNGSLAGLFGVLGDQAVITNVIIDSAISYLDYELDINKDSERVTLAIVAAQVKNDATVLFQNMAVLNSTTFAPETLSEDGEDGIDFIHAEVKSGIYVGWQQGVDKLGDKASGVIYMNDAHARMSSVMINIYLDLSGWDMSPDSYVNSFGGLIGEARQVHIEKSSYEGVVGIEVVRKDRNMDNAQFIFNAGGAVGTMDAYNDSTSYFKDVDLSGSIYLDTFKNENDGFSRNLVSAQSARDSRAVEWVSDVRQIGGIIGDANMWGQGNIELDSVNASFFVDAPKADRIQMGDQQSMNIGTQSSQDGLIGTNSQSQSVQTGSNTQSVQTDSNLQSINDESQTQSVTDNNSESMYDAELFGGKTMSQAIIDGDYKDPQVESLKQKYKEYSEHNATMTSGHELEVDNNKTARGGDETTGIEGPPTAPGGPIVFSLAAPALVFTISWGLMFAFGTTATVLFIMTGFIGMIIIIILILVIVIFAVLFAFWGAMKPKWESQVFVGSAVGSSGRNGIKLNNVHTAIDVMVSDTMFSNHDDQAEITDSHNTTPTRGMIKSQPESPEVTNIDDKVHLEVTAQGTIMKDGTPGVDSVLEYQWYYNEIDSNNILDGTEPNMGGAVTTIVEGATSPTLDLDVKWVGSRYYFARIINHVLEFKGNTNSVTARVGNKKVSLKPAEIVKQPQDISTNVATMGKNLSVLATASGDIDYQWYYNTVESMDGATLLVGVNKSEFVPFIQNSGIYYYYVVVTVSLPVSGSDETLRTDTVSRFAKVEALGVANDVKIAVQPESQKTVELNMNTTLGVQVDLSTINGALSYQWFKASNPTEDGIALDGETAQSLLVDTSISGSSSFYYVIVSNTVENDTKSTRSESSKITVAEDEALKINMIQPVSVSGIAGEHPLSISVYATADDGINLKYQWYESKTLGNTSGSEGTIMPGETSATLTLMESQVSTRYYYVEISAQTNNTAKTIQRSDAVAVEFKDATKVAFDLSYQKLQTATITSPQTMNNNLYDMQSTPNDIIDLQISLDMTDLVGNISFQWYKGSKIDGSDAVAIKGAVGSAWRVYKDSDVGQKYYFVKIVNSAQVYNSNLNTYTTILNDINLNSVAIVHPEAQNNWTTAIVIASASVLMIALFVGVVIVANKKKANKRYAYTKYGYGR